MKAYEGEKIVCKCAQPAGKFRHDVDDRASISNNDIEISRPRDPDDLGRYVCLTCEVTVAQQFFGDCWGVNTKNGWLE